jgi:hypothetical protein
MEHHKRSSQGDSGCLATVTINARLTLLYTIVAVLNPGFQSPILLESSTPQQVFVPARYYVYLKAFVSVPPNTLYGFTFSPREYGNLLAYVTTNGSQPSSSQYNYVASYSEAVLIVPGSPGYCNNCTVYVALWTMYTDLNITVSIDDGNACAGSACYLPVLFACSQQACLCVAAIPLIPEDSISSGYVTPRTCAYHKFVVDSTATYLQIGIGSCQNCYLYAVLEPSQGFIIPSSSSANWTTLFRTRSVSYFTITASLGFKTPGLYAFAVCDVSSSASYSYTIQVAQSRFHTAPLQPGVPVDSFVSRNSYTYFLLTIGSVLLSNLTVATSSRSVQLYAVSNYSPANPYSLPSNIHYSWFGSSGSLVIPSQVSASQTYAIGVYSGYSMPFTIVAYLNETMIVSPWLCCHVRVEESCWMLAVVADAHPWRCSVTVCALRQRHATIYRRSL